MTWRSRCTNTALCYTSELNEMENLDLRRKFLTESKDHETTRISLTDIEILGNNGKITGIKVCEVA